MERICVKITQKPRGVLELCAPVLVYLSFVRSFVVMYAAHTHTLQKNVVCYMMPVDRLNCSWNFIRAAHKTFLHYSAMSMFVVNDTQKTRRQNFEIRELFTTFCSSYKRKKKKLKIATKLKFDSDTLCRARLQTS